ncbi:M23 family metallopeptidase [Flavobacterium amnicola]|uniref:M23 family metallopeptidase n=1 Tax=Flavobacterium amnicola TaxID=2506422 RepID=A0A4Q1K4L1_9FLAO|nr:M23 family metallopeptidase [Flavobacterium amnicola]RXR18344.1 M23 family metallopeptidase [Flavobacterium amnicola]
MKIINQKINPFFSLFALFIGTTFVAQDFIKIAHKPEQPLIEKVNNSTVLNFDFIIENQSKDTLKLTKLEVRHFDKNNILVLQKFLDNNGTAPSINTIPSKNWDGVSKKLLFNPFPEMHSVTVKLEYIFTFNNTIEVKKTVIPKEYIQTTNFILPLKEKLLVYDGHDFNSHHRRFDYEFEFIKQLGFESNFMRYAYDFAVVNNENKQHTGTGENNSDWFGFGKEVLAVADGEIVALETLKLDDKNFDVPSLKKNPLALYGNYVVIKHSDNVLSMYAHLKNKSSEALKVGDKIKKGQVIGQIGTSGSSFFPHLHFEVRNGIDHKTEGIPSYFNNYSLHLGALKQEIKKGTVNTGDIIQSNQ